MGRGCTPLPGQKPPSPEEATEEGGTHPTGMRSCFIKVVYEKLFSRALARKLSQTTIIKLFTDQSEVSALPEGCMNQSEVSALPEGCMNQSEVSALPEGCMNQSEVSALPEGCMNQSEVSALPAG